MKADVRRVRKAPRELQQFKTRSLEDSDRAGTKKNYIVFEHQNHVHLKEQVEKLLKQCFLGREKNSCSGYVIARKSFNFDIFVEFKAPYLDYANRYRHAVLNQLLDTLNTSFSLLTTST